MSTSTEEALTLAIPKGRIEDQIQDYFAERGIKFIFENRKLVARDEQGIFKIILVKNADLPTYVHHGIAGLGICGEDVLYESGHEFFRLLSLPFGGTRMCLAAAKDRARAMDGADDWTSALRGGNLSIATKFPRFTRDYFHNMAIPVDIIKLNGSVELAPVLGLAPFIVDLVETGGTLKAHDLEIVQVLQNIGVYLVANPAYYKINYRRIDSLCQALGADRSIQ